MPEGVNPLDLIKTATELIDTTNGRPRQSNLPRAVSTAYYAMFHSLARRSANLLIGGPGATRSRGAWHQVYRALEHNFAKGACQNQAKIAVFPRQIQDFAGTFVTLQAKRHLADYDPREVFYKSEVQLQINVAIAIDGFERAPLKDRRAFAALVMFKTRT